MSDEETELRTTLSTMQQELEAEPSALGGFVGRFRGLDAPEGEDLARNTLRAYEAVADVLRMVRQMREQDAALPEPTLASQFPADADEPRLGDRLG